MRSTTSTSSNARGVGGLNAPSGSTGLDNLDQSIAVGNVWTLSPNTVNETRVQMAHGDLKAFSDRPHRAAGQHRRRRDVRHVLEKPDPAREHAVPGRQQPVAPGRTARAARRRRLPLQRRHHHVPAGVPGQLHVLVAGQLPGGHLQRLRPDVRRSGRHADEPERRDVRAGRMAGRSQADAEPRPALRPAVPRDHRHRHQQRVAARRLRLGAERVAGPRRPWRRRPLLRSGAAARGRQRAAVGGQHDRRQSAAPAAGHGDSPGAGRRAGVPDILPDRLPSTHPRVNHDDGQGACRTPTRSRPTSRSSARSAAAAC